MKNLGLTRRWANRPGAVDRAAEKLRARGGESLRATTTRAALAWLRERGHLPLRQGHAIECPRCGFTAVVLPELPEPHLRGELGDISRCAP